MIEILVIMALGILTGVALRGRKKFVYKIEKAVMWCIYLLLLLLGIAIGSDSVIMAGLPVLGLTAIIITLGGLAGSVILAALLWKYVFSKPR